MVKPRLVVFTPLPPAKTGTADYVPGFLASLPKALTDRYRIVFAVDRTHNPRATFDGYPLLSSTGISLAGPDVALYFVANNHFHRYVLAALRRHDARHAAVTVIHDLQCGMSVLDTCYGGQHGFAPADIPEFLSAELGTHAAGIAATAARNGPLGSLLRHLLLGQGLALAKSDPIIVHSHYAKMKLLCEPAPGARRPLVVVAKHPDLHPPDGCVPRAGSRRFVSGVFGWIAPSKRVIEVITAFERFAQRRTAARCGSSASFLPLRSLAPSRSPDERRWRSEFRSSVS